LDRLLAWEQDNDAVGPLFDREVRCVSIKAKDFVTGTERPPEQQGAPDGLPISVNEAHLTVHGTLNVSYKVNLEQNPEHLVLRVRLSTQQQPAWTARLHHGTKQVSLKLPEGVFAQIRDAASCSLAAVVHGEAITSPETWIIQEAHLTHEPQNVGGAADIERIIQENGRGLIEHIDELGARGGVQEVIEYLRNLSIHYSSGEEGGRLPRIGFRVKAHNPFRSDSIPEWIIQVHGKSSLEEALYEFLERHEKRVLWRHARKGNVNGLANYLDVFRAMMGLLFTYYRRNVVPREQLIGRICDWLRVFFVEASEGQEQPEGYFIALAENYMADMPLLRSQLVKHNVAGHMYAALRIAQEARMTLERELNGNPASYLPLWNARLKTALGIVELTVPSPKAIEDALKECEIHTNDEESASVAGATLK